MANTSAINRVGASTSSYNTGTNRKPMIPARMKGVIFVPSGTQFSTSSATDSQADFLAALQAGCINDTASSRYYAFKSNIDFKQDAQTQSANIPFGGKINLASGIPYFTFQFKDGDVDMYQNLLKFKDAQNIYDILFYDANGRVYGTNKTVGAGQTFGGFQCRQIWVDGWDAPDASNFAKYMLEVQLMTAEQWNENFLYVDTNVKALGDAIRQMNDVYLKVISGGTTNHIRCQAFNGFSNESLGQWFGSSLASTSLWTCTKNSDLSSMTVSAVSYVASGDYYDLTITTGTGVAATLGIAAPSVLAAAGIKDSLHYFEWSTYTQNSYQVNTDNSGTIV
jgi:hypothetical protein